MTVFWIRLKNNNHLIFVGVVARYTNIIWKRFNWINQRNMV